VPNQPTASPLPPSINNALIIINNALVVVNNALVIRLRNTFVGLSDWAATRTSEVLDLP
jgi:hypothetical protein